MSNWSYDWITEEVLKAFIEASPQKKFKFHTRSYIITYTIEESSKWILEYTVWLPTKTDIKYGIKPDKKPHVQYLVFDFMGRLHDRVAYGPAIEIRMKNTNPILYMWAKL